MGSRGEDDTVRLRPAAPAPPAAAPAQPLKASAPGRRMALAGGGLALLLAGAAALLLRPGESPPAPAPVAEAPSPPPAAQQVPAPSPAPTAAPAPRLSLPLASEAEILASRAPQLTLRLLAANPAILVLDFPSLAEQARMFNRIAALVEKSGLPRDRVLDDAALDTAVREGGTTADTFYYGHNYRAADLARFFALADRDGVRLTAEEERLRGLLSELGWLRADAAGALVSVPAEGLEPWLDRRARAAMLRHELSHGEFFTVPAYAAQVWRFWREMLTETERAALRRVLAEGSYDPAIEEVMANEAQAFLFHTPDDRFFNPGTVGFTPERVAALRAAFVAGMPPGWLRDAMTR